MLKKLLCALLFVALTVPVGAQQYAVNLKLAVAGTAVGFSSGTYGPSNTTCTANECINGNGHPNAVYASCENTAAGGTVAYRIDGGTATATTGTEVYAGSVFYIQGTQNLVNFSAIRTGSTSGDIRCVLSSVQ